MPSSTRRKSQMPPAPAKLKINLYCSRCDNQIGTFHNEFIRLTSSYVRPVRPGTHYGTEITPKAQVVPQGATNRALQGCTLAEVACEKCSAPVGQFCKSVATREQDSLLDQYFYKLSRTYLKDRETGEHTEPIFAYGEDAVHTRSSVGGRLSLPSAIARSVASQTPSRAVETPSLVQPTSEPQIPSFYQASPLHAGLGAGLKDDSILLEMRLRSQEERLAAQNARLQQQDTQIQLLTGLVNSFRDSVEEMKTTLRKLQSQRTMSQTEISEGTEFTGPLGPGATVIRQAQSGTDEADEVEQLRADNAALKERLNRIAMVMGAGAPTLSQTAAPAAGPQDSPPGKTLGKRKRNDGVGKSDTPRTAADTEDAAPSFQSRSQPPGDRSQISMQQSKKALRGRGSLQNEQSKLGNTPHHETSEDELERSGSELLSMFTQRTRTTTNAGLEMSVLRDEEGPSSSEHPAAQQETDGNIPEDDGATRVSAELRKPSGTQYPVDGNVEFSDDDLVVDLELHNGNPAEVHQGQTSGQAAPHLVPAKNVTQHSTQNKRTRGKTAEALVQLRNSASEEVQSGEIDKVNSVARTQGPPEHASHATAKRLLATTGGQEPPDGIPGTLSAGSSQEPADIEAGIRKQRDGKTISSRKESGTHGERPMNAEARLTRRQQLADEIRRRDQLAKEAMEMDD